MVAKVTYISEKYVTGRPWLELYNIRVNPPVENVEELAPIQKLLPAPMMVKIFCKLDIHEVAFASVVCKRWHTITQNEAIWANACKQQIEDRAINDEKLLNNIYNGAWRRMFLEHPRVRYDGIYVSRNTYLKRGIVEWRNKCPVHMVVYYRYYRFFRDGSLLYRTTPTTVKDVAQQFTAQHLNYGQNDDSPLRGTYVVQDSSVRTVALYRSRQRTQLRTCMTIRSTCRGAFNVLDISSLTTYDPDYDHEMDALDPSSGLYDDDYEDDKGLQHTKGRAPFVFVRWDQVASSIFNLSADQMDYYIPP